MLIAASDYFKRKTNVQYWLMVQKMFTFADFSMCLVVGEIN